MEQKTDGRPMVKCENCLFRSTHKFGWQFCLALADLIEGEELPMCNGEYYRELEDGDRYQQLVDAFRDLDE